MWPNNKISHFHQASRHDSPATEPDDRVNEMAGRAVHVAEVNPSAVMPKGKKVEAHDLQGHPSGGDSWTRTSVPFAQWSRKNLGAVFPLRFALTNSGRLPPRCFTSRCHWFGIRCKRYKDNDHRMGGHCLCVVCTGLEPVTPSM